MAQSEGLGVFSYSPLGGGILTGKYLKKETNNDNSRLTTMPMYKERYKDDKNAEIAQAFNDYATSKNINPISLAVAWVAGHSAITAPIIGGRSLEQVMPSLNAADIEITEEMRQEIASFSNAPVSATDRSEEA